VLTQGCVCRSMLKNLPRMLECAIINHAQERVQAAVSLARQVQLLQVMMAAASAGGCTLLLAAAAAAGGCC
jgi:hypothetical protein